MINLMAVREVLDANERYHDDEAASYDEIQPYIRNDFAQEMFRADIRAIIDTLKPFRPTLRVLDCGAGTGNLTLKFLQQGYEVTSVDISRNMLTRLAGKAAKMGTGRLETVHSDIDSFLRGASQRYDVICSSSFLHHLPDYRVTYGLMANVASDESIIYTAFEPKAHSRLTTVQNLFTKLDSGIYEIGQRRLYNPVVVMRAALRRMKVLPAPANVQFDHDLIERPDLGIDTGVLSAAVRPAGFRDSAICWRGVSRYKLTYLLNTHFVHLDNALFMISQKSVSGKQKPLTVSGKRFRIPAS